MQYNVPAQPCRVETQVSNSRFITSIRRATSTKEAQEIIREIRKEMPDANHHVYAYRIGYPPSVSEGMSDDGEPSGTSGPPVLAVLRGADVGDIVVVVTRYFGGTKLGTGGLVKAYTWSAQTALADLITERKVDRIACTLTYPYALHNQITRIITEHDVIVDGETFEAEVSVALRIADFDEDRLRRSLDDVSAGQARIVNAPDH